MEVNLISIGCNVHWKHWLWMRSGRHGGEGEGELYYQLLGYRKAWSWSASSLSTSQHKGSPTSTTRESALWILHQRPREYGHLGHHRLPPGSARQCACAPLSSEWQGPGWADREDSPDPDENSVAMDSQCHSDLATAYQEHGWHAKWRPQNCSSWRTRLRLCVHGQDPEARARAKGAAQENRHHLLRVWGCRRPLGQTKCNLASFYCTRQEDFWVQF